MVADYLYAALGVAAAAMAVEVCGRYGHWFWMVRNGGPTKWLVLGVFMGAFGIGTGLAFFIPLVEYGTGPATEMSSYVVTVWVRFCYVAMTILAIAVDMHMNGAKDPGHLTVAIVLRLALCAAGGLAVMSSYG